MSGVELGWRSSAADECPIRDSAHVRSGPGSIHQWGLRGTGFIYGSFDAPCTETEHWLQVNAKGFTPLDMLQVVKSIETRLGRQKTVAKGPRTIDLDILLHEDHVYDDQDLSIPHKAMLEREFVLRPLCE